MLQELDLFTQLCKKRYGTWDSNILFSFSFFFWFGQANEYKENQKISHVSLRPLQATVLEKTPKVCLVPFSLSDYKPGEFKLPQSLLNKNSNDEVACKKCKKIEIKKTFTTLLIPKTKATASSKAESTPQKPHADAPVGSGERPRLGAVGAVVLAADAEGSPAAGDSDGDSTLGLVRV